MQPSEILRTSRNHLHLMRHQCNYRRMDGRSQQLGQSAHRSFCFGFCCRSKVKHHPGLRCRVCSQEHSWRTHDDVAGTCQAAPNMLQVRVTDFLRRCGQHSALCLDLWRLWPSKTPTSSATTPSGDGCWDQHPSRRSSSCARFTSVQKALVGEFEDVTCSGIRVLTRFT
jgi:hypothetical protein